MCNNWEKRETSMVWHDCECDECTKKSEDNYIEYINKHLEEKDCGGCGWCNECIQTMNNL